MSNIHPAVTLTDPTGEKTEIDEALVPLIQALWQRGFRTVGCCQDVGESIRDVAPRPHLEGQVLLEMPVGDTCVLLDLLMATEQFADRLHWAAPDAWTKNVPILEQEDGRHDLEEFAQLYFPADQLDELVHELTRPRP